MSGKITDILKEWEAADRSDHEELWSLVYGEVHRLAGDLMNSERPHHTLQPTALVNEAYMKLVELKKIRYRDRTHFFAIAARLMRRILVDHARAKNTAKRNGGDRMPFDVTLQLADAPDADALDLDRALRRLEELEPEKARVVELRFFGGLTEAEIADELGCSQRTVRRHWRVAKLWLHRELAPRDGS
jgi:RNA polymerase sigma factor (TIGR02999 family)